MFRVHVHLTRYRYQRCSSCRGGQWLVNRVLVLVRYILVSCIGSLDIGQGGPSQVLVRYMYMCISIFSEGPRGHRVL